MLGVSVVLLAGSVSMLGAARGAGSGVLGLVLLVVLAGVAVASVRTVATTGRELRVWSPFRRTALDARACAFGVRVTVGARGGVTYVVHATDGRVSADVSEHLTLRGADDAVARLEAAFVEGESRARARVVARTRAQREAWQRQHREAQAQVDAYYRSPAWRRAKWLVVGGVLAYVAVMIVAQLAAK